MNGFFIGLIIGMIIGSLILAFFAGEKINDYELLLQDKEAENKSLKNEVNFYRKYSKENLKIYQVIANKK